MLKNTHHLFSQTAPPKAGVRRHRQIIGLMAAVLLAVSPILANSGRFAYKDDLLGLNNVSTYTRLDPTFNSVGFVTDTFGTNFNLASQVAVQPDGKIVITGAADQFSLGLIRYNADGSRDATFGVGGKVADTIANISATASGLALLPDGKIVVTGAQVTMGEGPSRVFYVARYNPNGSREWIVRRLGVPAPTCTQVHVCANQYMYAEVSAVAIQPDGKIIAAGGAGFANTPLAVDEKFDFALVRVNADGTPDASFGPGGGIRHRMVTDNDSITELALQPDGKIVAAGYATVSGNRQFAVARFNSDGSVDNTFDGDGRVIMQVLGGSEQAFDIKIQPDGKIVVAGDAFNGTINELAVVRFNADGLLDTSFDGDGKATTTFYGRAAFGRSLLLLPDGKIVIAGGTNNGTNDDFALVRYNSDGSLDRSFDLDGRAMLDLGITNDFAGSIAADGSGRTVVVGQRQGQIAVARVSTVVSISSTPFDFNADGRADLSVYRPSNNLWYVQTADAFYTREWGEAGDALAPADYDGDGRTDFAVFRPSNGTWYVMTSETYTFQATQWGQNGDLPTAADMNADGRADLALFRASTNTWFTKFASGGSKQVQFGEAGDKPVKGDFDGDGVPDLGVYRPSDNTWRIERSTDGPYVFQWGAAGDVTVPADYDGDGKTDLAVWRPSTGQWFRINSTEGTVIQSWGEAGDVPVPADYDGDGRTDLAVFRPSNGLWYIVNSADNTIYLQQFGRAEDISIPAAYNN